MGVHKAITDEKFPKQGPHLHKKVEVIFHFNTSRRLFGVIVRDDYEDPWHTIIKLDNGRYVLATECQYTIID